MNYVIHIEVADEEMAKQVVDDTKETDSMCLITKDGDELEFGIVSISCGKKD